MVSVVITNPTWYRPPVKPFAARIVPASTVISTSALNLVGRSGAWFVITTERPAPSVNVWFWYNALVVDVSKVCNAVIPSASYKVTTIFASPLILPLNPVHGPTVEYVILPVDVGKRYAALAEPPHPFTLKGVPSVVGSLILGLSLKGYMLASTEASPCELLVLK